MSTIYEECPKGVADMAASIISEFESHQPLADAGVKVDFIFAQNEDGDAIKWAGAKALALCRKLGLKDRAMGRGDAEILIDMDWWINAGMEEKRALLDHELHHIEVVAEKRDDLGRPVIKLRKHDVQVGWFRVIAERHGQASTECQQARLIYDAYGQAFWPNLTKASAASNSRIRNLETVS